MMLAVGCIDNFFRLKIFPIILSLLRVLSRTDVVFVKSFFYIYCNDYSFFL